MSSIDSDVPLRARSVVARLCGASGLGLLAATALVIVPVVGSHPSSVAGAAGNPVLVVGGDISCSVTDSNFSGSNPASCQQRATASLVHSIGPSYLLPGGDTQYAVSQVEGGQPTAADYTGGYGGSWGQLQNPTSSNYVPGLVVRPTPGDNEYGDANETDSGAVGNASNYYSYFSSQGDLPAGVTGPSSDFYSFDVPVTGGTWHVVSLDGECAALPATVGGAPSQSAAGCASGSPQETFLRNDLAAHQGDCILLHFHQPEFSEGFGTDTDYQAFWADAVQYHVTAIVNGHAHSYERFRPVDQNETPDSAGPTEIVVGTGGNSHGSDVIPDSNVVASDFSDFGVLQLTLHAASADFAFRTIGNTTSDSGTISCYPVVSGLSTSAGLTSGGNTLTVTGSNFSGTPVVRFGSTQATNVSVNSSTSLTATVPPASAGTVDVTVSNAPPTRVSGSGPTSTTSSADQYTYEGPPVVTGVSPSGGPVAGGTTATVTGTGLSGATEVDFGGNRATNVSVTSSTSLTATAPAGSAGAVDVTVTTPFGTSTTDSADRFTYFLVPTVTGVAPDTGPSFGGTQVTVTGTNLAGATDVHFGGNPATGVVANGAGTLLTVHAPAGAHGLVDVSVTTPGGTSATGSGDRFTYQKSGYWMVGNDGGIFSFGGAPYEGSLPGLGLHVTDIVGLVPTSTGRGYWMIGNDGGVFAFGDAGFVGSLPGINVHVGNIVAAVPTSTGRGYWMIGKDGGVFAFGDAGFVGSLPGLNIHVGNIVAAVPTSTGRGYWMIGKDGGVFAFGDAGFVGSLPGINVHVGNIVAAVPTSTGRGYWMIGSDGGVFAFGDAGFVGSLPGLDIHVADIVGVVATADGKGYWMVGDDGGVFAFGDAGFLGSVPGLGLRVTNVVAFAPQ